MHENEELEEGGVKQDDVVRPRGGWQGSGRLRLRAVGTAAAPEQEKPWVSLAMASVTLLELAMGLSPEQQCGSTTRFVDKNKAGCCWAPEPPAHLVLFSSQPPRPQGAGLAWNNPKSIIHLNQVVANL